MKGSLLAVVVFVAASFALASANPPATGSGNVQRKARPEDLWLKTISPTHTGRIHAGCKEFADPEAMVSRGPITKVAVYQGDFVHAIRLWYGSDGVGLANGFTETASHIAWDEFEVPEGERITRVEGGIARDYVVWLQFFTDRGTPSHVFGKKRGAAFVVTDKGGGALRTISGWANFKRHPALYRAITSLTFQFGAPYFVKKIEFDQKALDTARLKAPPEQCASQDFTNETSLEQSSNYTNALTLTKTTTFSFEQSFGLKFTVEAWLEASAVLAKAGGKVSYEVHADTKSTQSFSSSREESVSWSVPVKVPPRSRVIASSTWKKYRVSVPFTYTVAWYVGTRDNVKKEVTLPGLYEDVRVDDLKHEFKEFRLK